MGGIKADDLTRLRKELERRGYNPSKMSMDPSGPAGRIIRKVGGEIGIMFDPPRTVKKKDGGLMAAIRKVDAEKKFKNGKTVEADPTFEAMLKRNGKKTEKKTEKKKKVAITGDLGALAANTRVPRLKKSTIVKREDPNKRRPKVSDFGPRKLGDSLLMPVLFSTLAKTGLMDKKDKVTHPMEAKKFSQGKSVEADMNRGNTTKNFKGSF